MEKIAKVREPDLELSSQATKRLTDIANGPHDPAAAKVNLARALDSLRRRRAETRARKSDA